MKSLPNVTLFQCDDPFSERAIHAMRQCSAGIDFAESIIYDGIESYADYNLFCIQRLKAHFDTSHVLLVQWDGYVLKPEKWEDAWLEYDYIGAPMWNGYVGNGGFSLRSKKFCEAASQLDLTARNEPLLQSIGVERKDWHNEDLMLCIEHKDELEAMGIKFAPLDVAREFSWEQSGRFPYYHGSFGFHSPRSMEFLMQHGLLT